MVAATARNRWLWQPSKALSCFGRFYLATSHPALWYIIVALFIPRRFENPANEMSQTRFRDQWPLIPNSDGSSLSKAGQWSMSTHNLSIVFCVPDALERVTKQGRNGMPYFERHYVALLRCSTHSRGSGTFGITTQSTISYETFQRRCSLDSGTCQSLSWVG